MLGALALNFTGCGQSNEHAKTINELAKKAGHQESINDWGGAVETYKKIAELEPRNSDAWASLGNAYNGAKDYEKAIDALNKSLDLNSNNASAWLSLGVSYKDKAVPDFDRAIEYETKALNLGGLSNADTSTAYTIIGFSYGNKGNYDKAIENLNKAIDIDPKNAQAWSDLGVSYANRGELERGLECLNKAIELDPRNDHAWRNLKIFKEQLGIK